MMKIKERIMNIEKISLKKVLLLLTVISITVTGDIYAQVSSKEKKALIELNERTEGQNWDQKWNFDEPVSNWHGIKVVNGKVQEINLFRNNLKGAIPESIGNLKNLIYLNLAFNKINGEIPLSITKLSKLKVLKLEMNVIMGELPNEIGNLTSLEEFTVFNNLISGEIPESFGEMKKLKVLNLSSNKFEGSIPLSLGNLTQLESLGLFENSLKGAIPNQIGNLTKLKELVLANNEFGGEIPVEFGQLASLEVFQIQNNKFDSFKNLQEMDTRQFLVFDYDKDDIKMDFKDIKFSKTRMADTKFDDEENE